MPKKIFVNLPVKDLGKTEEFFRKLGFGFDAQFTNEKAACLIIEEGSIYAMLLAESFFKTFTKKDICDAKRYTEVLLAVEVETREKVDGMVKKAVNAGGSVYKEPMDYGWMYGHSFADLDGHQWEVFCMDESAVPQKQ